MYLHSFQAVSIRTRCTWMASSESWDTGSPLISIFWQPLERWLSSLFPRVQFYHFSKPACNELWVMVLLLWSRILCSVQQLQLHCASCKYFEVLKISTNLTSFFTHQIKVLWSYFSDFPTFMGYYLTCSTTDCLCQTRQVLDKAVVLAENKRNHLTLMHPPSTTQSISSQCSLTDGRCF